MTAGRAKALHQEKKAERKAANILKRRDKPLKPGRKHTTSKPVPIQPTKAPEGFQFLPYGTDELAKRCKQLSKARGLPVHMVSARPRVEIARDPSKVSYHSHRIGYHFRSEVVDEACRELEYVFHENRFIKESALREQHERKRLTELMAKHGLQLDPSAEEEEESYEQRRAAIAEQFPNIPEDDLQGVVEHAWQKGTKRVGHQTELSLSRRAQLATIAGIRHQYTDYDKLLRAFDRQTARTIVEEATLKKVMEWRGETTQADQDDNDLVEVLNQLIIIDDDDGGVAPDGGDADDEDSATGLDSGDASDSSDASVQITYTRIGTEEMERDITGQNVRQHHVGLQQGIRNIEYHDMDARQKIGYVRQQMRNARALVPPGNSGTVPSEVPRNSLLGNTNVVRVNVSDHQRNDGQVLIDGQLFKREAPSEQVSRQALYQDPRSPLHLVPNGYENTLDARAAPQSRWAPQTLWQTRPVVASIEPAEDHPGDSALSTPVGGGYAPPNGRHLQLVTSELPRAQKRRRMEEPDAYQWMRSPQRYRHRLQNEGAAFHVNTDEGTAPLNSMLPSHNTLAKESDAFHYNTGVGRHAAPDNIRPHDVYQLHTLPHSHVVRTQRSDLMPGQSAVPYDPRPSMIVPTSQEHGYAGFSSRSEQLYMREPANAQIAPIQYLPRAFGKNDRFTTIPNPRLPQYAERSHRIVYNPDAYPETSASTSGFTPRPLHGEPAPIQQMPRGYLQPNQVAPNTRTPLANVSTSGASTNAPAPVFTPAPIVYPYYPS